MWTRQTGCTEAAACLPAPLALALSLPPPISLYEPRIASVRSTAALSHPTSFLLDYYTRPPLSPSPTLILSIPHTSLSLSFPLSLSYAHSLTHSLTHSLRNVTAFSPAGPPCSWLPTAAYLRWSRCFLRRGRIRTYHACVPSRSSCACARACMRPRVCASACLLLCMHACMRVCAPRLSFCGRRVRSCVRRTTKRLSIVRKIITGATVRPRKGASRCSISRHLSTISKLLATECSSQRSILRTRVEIEDREVGRQRHQPCTRMCVQHTPSFRFAQRT